MNDTISRREALDIVEHITSSMSICFNEDECHGMKRMQQQVILELANMPPAQPKEDIRAMCGECDAWNQYKNYSQPRWIPVTERLPEKPNTYIVTDSKGDVVKFVFTGTESSRKYWRRCAKAWMPQPPLPPPYQEERGKTNGET